MTAAESRSSSPIRYRGVVDGRLLELTVTHRLLDSPRIQLRIDGEEIPQREGASADGDASPSGLFWTMNRDDGLQFHVHRPREEESTDHRVHERIEVRTRSLGRAGEVDVRTSRWGSRTALLPDDGTRSAARDASLRAHPYRRAVQRGVMASLKVVVPLLGITEFLDRVTQPAQDAAAEAAEPTVSWIAQLLEPVALLVGAISDAIAALFSWIGPLLAFLLGWVPPLLDWLPSWGLGPAASVVIILVSAFTAYHEGRKRVGRLDAQEAALATHLHRRILAVARGLMAHPLSPPADHPPVPRRSGH